MQVMDKDPLHLRLRNLTTDVHVVEGQDTLRKDVELEGMSMASF